MDYFMEFPRILFLFFSVDFSMEPFKIFDGSETFSRTVQIPAGLSKIPGSFRRSFSGFFPKHKKEKSEGFPLRIFRK